MKIKKVKYYKSVNDQIIQFLEKFEPLSLHQNPKFASIVEPNRDCVYCAAYDNNAKIIAYCCIHIHFPVLFIQDGPLAETDEVAIDLIFNVKMHFKYKFYAFMTVQLAYSDLHYPKIVSDYLPEKYYNLPTWATIIVDCNDIENIKKSFSTGNLATNIRKAEKKGITTNGTFSIDVLSKFSSIYDYNYLHRNIRPTWGNTYDYFYSIKEYIDNNQAFFIGSYLDNKLVAGGIFLISKNTVYYKYGASDKTIKGIPLMHTVIYNAILKACELKCQFFDLNGINPRSSGSDQVAAITMFKRSFHGKEILSPERIYLNINPLFTIFFIILKFFKNKMH